MRLIKWSGLTLASGAIILGIACGPTATPTSKATPTAITTVTPTPRVSQQPTLGVTPTKNTSPTLQPTPTTNIAAIGQTRSNPAAIGASLTFKGKDSLVGDYEVRITLLETIRGDDAWNMLKEANQFNDAANTGFEYILAKVRFDYLKGSPDKQYSLYGVNKFTAVSAEGKDYESKFEVEPDPQLQADLYPGASHEGWVAFHVAQSDSKPLMTFGRDFRGSGGAWWKLFE
jgi:hypothetical protein